MQVLINAPSHLDVAPAERQAHDVHTERRDVVKVLLGDEVVFPRLHTFAGVMFELALCNMCGPALS